MDAVAGPRHIYFCNVRGRFNGRISCKGSECVRILHISGTRKRHSQVPDVGFMSVVFKLPSCTARWAGDYVSEEVRKHDKRNRSGVQGRKFIIDCDTDRVVILLDSKLYRSHLQQQPGPFIHEQLPGLVEGFVVYIYPVQLSGTPSFDCDPPRLLFRRWIKLNPESSIEMYCLSAWYSRVLTASDVSMKTETRGACRVVLVIITT
jgi:hypothetical protein